MTHLRYTHLNTTPPGKPHITLNDRLEVIGDDGEVLADLSEFVNRIVLTAKVGDAFTMDCTFYNVEVTGHQKCPATFDDQDFHLNCELWLHHDGEHIEGPYHWMTADSDPTLPAPE